MSWPARPAGHHQADPCPVLRWSPGRPLAVPATDERPARTRAVGQTGRPATSAGPMALNRSPRVFDGDRSAVRVRRPAVVAELDLTFPCMNRFNHR